MERGWLEALCQPLGPLFIGRPKQFKLEKNIYFFLQPESYFSSGCDIVLFTIQPLRFGEGDYNGKSPTK